jgi:hypothetical protein
MNVLIAMLDGLAGGALGAATSFFITIGLCQALNVSNREGASGYLGMAVALVMGLAAMILSIVMTLRYRGVTAGAFWAQAPLALVGIVAIAGIGMFVYYNSHDHPITNGAAPALQFQLQAPPNASVPDPKSIKVELQAGQSRADAWWDDGPAAQADGVQC